MTIILSNKDLDAQRNYDAPEPFVFPNPAKQSKEDFPLSCLSIIRVRTGKVVTMKLVMRNYAAE